MRSIQALSMSADQRRCNWATGRHPDAQFFTSVSVDDVLCFDTCSRAIDTCSRATKRVPGLGACRSKGCGGNTQVGRAGVSDEGMGV